MKLRNKKTGEIIKLRDNEEITIPLEDKDGDWYEECYSSIDNLNEEWEDYEEPKPQVVYYIDRDGEIVSYKNVEYPKRVFNTEQNKEIGNYFDTREEAEKAVEKLKAWKRLKDKGFVFKGIDERSGSIKTGLTKGVSFNECAEFYDDMNLLFGGEE